VKVRVFGLQGSGTNFVEWTVMNNFNGLGLSIEKKAIRNVEGDVHYGKTQNLKHCYPINDSDFFNIIIQRDFDEWINSNHVQSSNYTKETYNYYYDTPIREKWDTKDYILVNHRWCVLNYYDFLKLISQKTNCDIKEHWEQPKYKMAISNGKKMTKTPYEY